MAEEMRNGVRVELYPTPYILNADKFCWWLTRIKPKKDNPFEMVESESLGYYPTPGDCLRSLPRKVLTGGNITDLKELIAAVESMEKTMVELKDSINEKVGVTHEK